LRNAREKGERKPSRGGSFEGEGTDNKRFSATPDQDWLAEELYGTEPM